MKQQDYPTNWMVYTPFQTPMLDFPSLSCLRHLTIRINVFRDGTKTLSCLPAAARFCNTAFRLQHSSLYPSLAPSPQRLNKSSPSWLPETSPRRLLNFKFPLLDAPNAGPTCDCRLASVDLFMERYVSILGPGTVVTRLHLQLLRIEGSSMRADAIKICCSSLIDFVRRAIRLVVVVARVTPDSKASSS